MKKILIALILITFQVDLHAQCTNNLTATIPYNGIISTGNYRIWPGLGKTCSNINKPIIVVEGFDPFNNFATNNIYQLINYSTGFAANLQANGYDVIILNFANGTDYIQRNAYLLEEFINRINTTLKVGNEPNIVIGLSMGGLVARYALADMEKRGINHETRLFISFDSPQNGAYVPLGMQYMVKHLKESSIGGGIPQLQSAIDLVNSPAAKQMLAAQTVDVRAWIDFWGFPHIEMTDNNSVHISFTNELKTLGYPQQCRNIAVCNGSINSTEQIVFPSQQLLRIFNLNKIIIPFPFITTLVPYSSFEIPLAVNYFADFQINALPNDGQQHTIYHGDVFAIVGGVPHSVVNPKTVQSSKPPFDSSPGGVYDINTYLDPSSFPMEVTLGTDKFCFVPTVNALDINLASGEGPYHNISTDPLIRTKTPFDNFFGSYNKNQEHIEFTTDNTAFLLDEIYNPKPKSICSSLYGTTVPTDLNLATYENKEQYVAQNTITVAGSSNFTIPTGKKVSLYTGNGITLGAGFHASAGSEFKAGIIDCFTPISSSRLKSAKSDRYDYSDDKPDVILINGKTVDEYIKDLEKKGKDNDDFQLYPNPAKDRVFTRITNKNTKILIFDMQGRLMFDEQYLEIGLIEIPLTGLSKGVYLVRIKNDNIKRDKKLIIE